MAYDYAPADNASMKTVLVAAPKTSFVGSMLSVRLNGSLKNVEGEEIDEVFPLYREDDESSRRSLAHFLPSTHRVYGQLRVSLKELIY